MSVNCAYITIIRRRGVGGAVGSRTRYATFVRVAQDRPGPSTESSLKSRHVRLFLCLAPVYSTTIEFGQTVRVIQRLSVYLEVGNLVFGNDHAHLTHTPRRATPHAHLAQLRLLGTQWPPALTRSASLGEPVALYRKSNAEFRYLPLTKAFVGIYPTQNNPALRRGIPRVS